MRKWSSVDRNGSWAGKVSVASFHEIFDRSVLSLKKHVDPGKSHVAMFDSMQLLTSQVVKSLIS